MIFQKIPIILLCFLWFISFSLWGQSSETQEIIDNSVPIEPEIIQQSTSSDNIIIKNVNYTYYNKNISADGYTQAVLTGDVHAVYMGKDIYADEIIIKFLGGEAEVLIARGNVLLKEEDRTIIARALFLYVKKQDLQLLEPITLQNNIYMRGLGIRFNKEDLTNIKDISLTTSLRFLPRYTIRADSGWIEQDNDLILLNAYLSIGQDPVLYFPIFYNNHYGTGIITNIIYDAYLGYMIYNTYSQKSNDYTEKLMVDYYQKMGVYMGNTYSRTDIGNLKTHVALAYDYHIQFKNGIVNNVFEQVLGEGPSIGRSLRYNLLFDYSKQLIEPDTPDGFSLLFKTTYKEMSDPEFESQFEYGRKEDFDIKNTLFSDNSGYSKIPRYNSGTIGRSFSNSLSMGFYGYNLQISTDVQYALNARTSTERLNSYSPSYWKNMLNSQNIPSISLNKAYQIYTISHSFADKSKITIPIKLDILYNFNNNANYTIDGLRNKSMENQTRAIFSSNITYNTASSFFSLYFPLSLENNFRHTFHQSYNSYQNIVSLDSSSKKYNNSLAFNYSPALTFKILDNLTLTETLNMKTTYGNNSSVTDESTSTIQQNTDGQDNYNTLNQNLGTTTRLEWVEETRDYLSGYIEGTYLYLYNNKYGPKLVSGSESNTKNHSGNLSFNFLKTTFIVKTSNNYGTGITEENRYDSLVYSVNSTLLPYAIINNTFTWDRNNQRASNNSFRFGMTMPTKLNITSWLWFSSIDIAFSLDNNMQNPIMDSLTYRFSFNFNITPLWFVELFLFGKNNSLYFYGDSAPIDRRKNIFVDFFQSFAFWSNDLRQDSGFKMENVGLTLRHDLDEWFLIMSTTFAPKVTALGSFYFDMQFSISVILKNLDMLSAPAMIQGTQESDYL